MHNRRQRYKFKRLHEREGFLPVSEFKAVGLKFGRRLDVVDYELIVG